MKNFFVFLLLLTGCFRGDHQDCLVDINKTDLVESIAYADGSIKIVEKIAEDWWTLFGDPQLNWLIEAALASNPTIREAEHRVCLAYEVALEARAKLLPYLDGFGEAEREKLSLYGFGLPGFIPLIAPLNRNYSLITLLLRGSWEIDLWGRNRNLYQSRLSETTASYADLLESKLILSTSIATAYFSLQSHLKQLEILKKEVDDKKLVVKLLKQRFQKGIADEFFVYQEDSKLAAVQDAANRMQGMIQLDKHALSALVSNPATICDLNAEICVAPSAHYNEPFPLPVCLPIDLIARRPDIRSAIWRIDAMSRRVKAAKARFLPSIDLFAAAGFISFFWGNVIQTESFNYDAGGNSVLPIYTGGELSARLGQSQEELEIAVQQYNQTILQAVKEVADALSELKTADERQKEIGRALNDAEALLRLTNQKYERGMDTAVSQLNAKSNVFMQELVLEEIALARMEAIVATIRAVGGGYVRD